MFKSLVACGGLFEGEGMNRDLGIKRIKRRDGKFCSGMGLGVIILDEIAPGFPGDVRNASAYPFPIQYEVAKSVNCQSLFFNEDKMPCWIPIKEAAQSLVQLGCRAVVAECGYFAFFQRMLANEIDVPVFASSLLQVPWCLTTLGERKSVGILVLSERHFSEQHFAAVGIEMCDRYRIRGVRDSGLCPEILKLYEAESEEERGADYEVLESQLVQIAKAFVEENGDMGALVLECSLMQPFARAIQREVNLPVFSFGTLMDYAYSTVVHRDFYGHV